MSRTLDELVAVIEELPILPVDTFDAAEIYLLIESQRWVSHPNQLVRLHPSLGPLTSRLAKSWDLFLREYRKPTTLYDTPAVARDFWIELRYRGAPIARSHMLPLFRYVLEYVGHLNFHDTTLPWRISELLTHRQGFGVYINSKLKVVSMLYGNRVTVERWHLFVDNFLDRVNAIVYEWSDVTRKVD